MSAAPIPGWLFWVLLVVVACAYVILGLMSARDLCKGIADGTYMMQLKSFRMAPFLHAKKVNGLLGSDATEDEQLEVPKRFSAEFLADVMLVWVSFVIVLLVTTALGTHKVPTLLTLFLCLGASARVKILDVSICQEPGETLPSTARRLITQDLGYWSRFPSFTFLLGVIDSVDGVLAGCTLCAAFLLSTAEQTAFVDGWSTGTAAAFHGVVATLGLGWLMLVSDVYTCIVQIAAANIDPQMPMPLYSQCCAILGRFAGLGASAKQLMLEGEDDAAEDNAALQNMLMKLIPENIPRLFWQSSVFMAQAHVKQKADATVVASLLVSTAMGLKLSFSQFVTLYQRREIVAARLRYHPSDSFLVSGVVLIGPCLCLAVAARTVIAFCCKSHQWGFSTGCIAAH